MSEPEDLLRRYLRQRGELGDGMLFLDRFTGRELDDLLAQAPSSPGVLAPEPTSAGAGDAAVQQAAGAPAPGPTASELVQLGTLDELREVALGCPRCRLAESRQHVVFGEGSPTAQLLVVGEAPGADEDRTGHPFVGRAGKMLTLLLVSVGLRREDIYICNVLKCRPPGNRNPQPDEVEACSPYLLRQVELIAPRVVLACGTFAAQTLLGTTTPIGRLRGDVHDFQGVPLIATYHPAALLRNSGWVRVTWEDFQRVRSILGS